MPHTQNLRLLGVAKGLRAPPSNEVAPAPRNPKQQRCWNRTQVKLPVLRTGLPGTSPAPWPFATWPSRLRFLLPSMLKCLIVPGVS